MENAGHHAGTLEKWRDLRTVNPWRRPHRSDHNAPWLIGVMALLLMMGWPMLHPETGTARASQKQQKFNVIMVWIDALRADHLGCYGYGRGTSPNMDKLAKEAVVFKNNFTPHTVTIASFMSILTSLYPVSHGVLHVAKDKLSTRVRTLPEVLKLYGYYNLWFAMGGCPHLDPQIGYGRGFDSVNDFPVDLVEGRRRIGEALEKNRDNRFFLNFHTYHVHDPYVPSPKYKAKFTRERKAGVIESWPELERAAVEEIRSGIREKKGMAWNILGPDLAIEMGSQDLFRPDPAASKQRILSFLKARDRRYKWADIVTGVYQATFKCGKLDVINHLKCLYDADILEFDTEIIGPLVKKLRDLGIYEKTIIVLCADHGDEFCEHGTQGHGTTLYEEVIHVPLIIKVPGLRGGKVVEELTQTVDIMPTIIELLGIPVPHRAQGKSLVPLMKGEATGTMRKYAFGHLPGDESYIRSKQWKLIRYWDGRKELFHISEDRGEERNLWSKRPDVGLMLEKELVAWEKSLPSFKVQSRFLPNIDEQTRKKIKETGYW